MNCDLIQPTDLYPDITKALWHILKKEMIHVNIYILPYLPPEYTNSASQKIAGKLDILSVFDQGPVYTFLKFHKTNYYHIMKSTNKMNLLTLCIYAIKFYRYSRYIKRLGIDLHFIFSDHQKRDPSYHLGKIVTYSVDKIIPTKEFNAYDKDILQLFEKNFFKVLFGIKKTNYFHIQREKRRKSIWQTFRWVYKYYKLYTSIKTTGFKNTNNGLQSFPWLFVSPKITIRLDGHHRAGVARHLRIKNLPVLLVTKDDLANHDGISPELFQSIL